MTEDTVASLAVLVGGRVIGDASRRIDGVADLRTAGPTQIGFMRDQKYRESAVATAAGCVITGEPLPGNVTQIVVADVGVAYAKVALHFHPALRALVHRVHPTATVHPEAELLAPVEIGPLAVVGRARVGTGSVIMSGVSIGDGCSIGSDCIVYPNAVIYPGVRLGDRVVIHGCVVIGSDGFGYAREDGRWHKVPQLGGVVIEDDVEIGAGCAIDRGAIGDTRIGAGTKIDNHCHVAHNCNIGRDVAMAAGAMIAGSTKLGDRVTLGGHVVVAGHIEICADARIGGSSLVFDSVGEPGDYMGWGLQEFRQFGRFRRALRELVDMQSDLAELKRRVGAPEPRGD
jgi:UDP-3-O-[3-hydroxymyristoyl] glucosamine N-acyltransferase